MGRTSELAMLDAFIAGIADGSPPGAVAVIGEAGIGKSTLLAKALLAAGTILDVVRLAGYEPERNVPLSAAQPLVRPALRDAAHTPPDQLALFETIHAWLSRRTVPTLIVVDDLQWVDDDSRALIHYLVRGAAQEAGRLAVLSAQRPDAAAAAFVESLGRLLGERLRHVELAPLSVDEGIELAGRLGTRLPAEEVTVRAAGSPFWIEVLATSFDSGFDARQVVEARLRRLDADAMELLALLSVAGRPMPAGDSAAVLGWGMPRSRRAIDQLTSAGVARLGASSISPAHDLIREAVVEGLPTPTRLRLHRELARRLEAIASGDVRLLREALAHRLAAGDLAPDLALAIARSPSRRLLGSEGLSDLVVIAEAMPSHREAADLNEAMARLASELGEHGAALERWGHVLEVASPANRGEVAVEALRSAIDGEDVDVARRLVREVRLALRRTPDPTLEVTADALEASVARWLEGRPAEARRLSERALAGARRLAGEQALTALDERMRRAHLDALAAANDAAMQAIERARMLELARETTEVAATGDHVRRLRAVYQLGLAQDMNGLLRECEATMSAVWLEAERRLLPQVRIDAGYFLALAQFELGRVGEARTVAREVAGLLDRLRTHLRFGNRIARPLALVEIVSGDWRAGLNRLEADVSQQPDPHSHGRVLTDLGVWTARLAPGVGGHSRGRDVAAIVARALDAAERSGCHRCTQEAYVVGADALATAQQLDVARQALETWQRLRPVEANLNERLHAARAAARLDGTPEAGRRLREAIEEADRSGHVVAEVLGWLALADHAGAQERSMAADAVTRAGRLAADHGLKNLEALARQQARLLGVRTWRRSRLGGGNRLSPRELQVVELVASGATNAEIAADLFISPRTVDRHVENILRKAGVRNRAALAAAAQTNGWYRG